MIDLHCHILPGIDDGPSDFLGFLEMANTAVSAGITHVFATPHHLNGQYENSRDDILVCVLETIKYTNQENIPLLSIQVKN